jgi:mono/diheme cytochrome c family protein
VTRRRTLYPLLAAAVVLALALAAWVVVLNQRDEAPLRQPAPAFEASTGQVARGAYLALAGNCVACHTVRGGAAYAGGRAVETPFGTVYGPNLTPDVKSGLGAWSADEFWRALHNGRSRDGRLLYPAFPYPSFTQITREDSDALYAYLRSLAPIEQPNRPNTLRFPYNLQASLAVWRALFFVPGVYVPDEHRSAQWNRGAYLVRGPGHCVACHTARNALGASIDELELSGGLIPMQGWYAPALAPVDGAPPPADRVDLLQTGVSRTSSVMGPMAEVVARSTQHLKRVDVEAMAEYLQSLPPIARNAKAFAPAEADVLQRGGAIYREHCATCHGASGQGAPGAYAPLAGNHDVSLPQTANLTRIVERGGCPPSSGGNPRPYGMPPFGQTLSDQDIADVLSYIRQSWGNAAGPVSVLEVHRARVPR